MSRKSRESYRSEVGNGEELGGRSKKRRRESGRSVDADRGYLLLIAKQRGKCKALRTYIRTVESMPPLSHLIRGFRNRYNN